MSDDIHQVAIKTAEYLYSIEGDTYDGEVGAISRLRQLINEEFVGKGKSVSSQLIYDIMHPVIDQALTAYKKELLSKANVYNVKSINGELVEPNTGVQAIPLSAIQEDEVENV